MNRSALSEFLSLHKDFVLREMTHRIKLLPPSSFQDFIVRTEEGRRRMDFWLKLIIRALESDPKPFVLDQEKVGYSRAVQGFALEEVSSVYRVFQDVLWQLLFSEKEGGERTHEVIIAEVYRLWEILFQGFTAVSASFLRTREERIKEKIAQLEELYDFTKEIVTTLDLKRVVGLIMSKTRALFDVKETHLALYRDDDIHMLYSDPKGTVAPEVQHLLEKTVMEGQANFVDEGGIIYKDIEAAGRKRIVSLPVILYGSPCGALILCNKNRGFRFTRKEVNLAYQFIHITAVALENAFMLEKIEQGRRQSRLLTARIVTIQEEERRRLAADIHDTLTQTLTGMSYKIQFCRELAKRNQDTLALNLNELFKNANHAIEQSRQLISSLRPDLMGRRGLISALREYVRGFTRETNIKVNLRMPRYLRLPSDIEICIFRVVQEALMNIYKHAMSDSAELEICRRDGNVLLMVTDQGRGFVDVTSSPSRARDKQPRLGLLSIKERVEGVGGTLVITSGINQGCIISAKIPLKD